MSEPVWIDERDVLALHSRLLALEGGTSGVRDAGLLKSALARQVLAYGENPDIIDMAAAYMAGIARNAGFLDGNRRTGFVVGVLFLEINGCRFVAPEEDATQAMLELAAGKLEERAFNAWLRANVRRK